MGGGLVGVVDVCGGWGGGGGVGWGGDGVGRRGGLKICFIVN